MTTHDPFDGRTPTSHERLTRQPWDASYHDGPPPWDVGYPQPAIVRLAAARQLRSPLLDVGCGTGENTLHIAASGIETWGVDVARSALATARHKAAERRLSVQFMAADALHLEQLGRRFATVVDAGLFHTFDATERQRYALSLASATQIGGIVHVLCFSDEGSDRGPHPVSQTDLRLAFCPANGWEVEAIIPERVQTRFHPDGAAAWLATTHRVAPRSSR